MTDVTLSPSSASLDSASATDLIWSFILSLVLHDSIISSIGPRSPNVIPQLDSVVETAVLSINSILAPFSVSSLSRISDVAQTFSGAECSFSVCAVGSSLSDEFSQPIKQSSID